MSDLDKAKQALSALESMDYQSGSVGKAIKSVRGAVIFLTSDEGETK